tara:strand:+ start:573 stop:1178 length:606 start_codon:yes stop_codon:yes gene_type:complete
MAANPDDIGEFFDKVLSEWDKEIFHAAFLCAQTAALYIDMSARQSFKKATGSLAGSFNPVPAVRQGGKVVAGAYSPLPYAGIRETGGTIKPNSPTKALSIPVTKKAMNIGSPLMWSGKELVYLPPKRGKLGAAGVFALPIGKATKDRKQKFSVQYVLMYFVKQKGSGYISKARKVAGPEMDKIVADRFVNVFSTVDVPKAK